MSKFITLPDASHFNARAGYTTFDFLLEKMHASLDS